MPNVGETVILSLLLITLGAIAALRQRFSLDIGRVGFFRPKSIFTMTLTGPRAILFGSISILIGIGLLLLCGYVLIVNDIQLAKSGILILVAIAGGVLAAFTFIVELLMEFLVSIRIRAEENKHPIERAEDNNA